jgi:hypothetical protein
MLLGEIIQSEADEIIRRALRNKVRASEQVFEHGDNVFYKREGKERWLGPGEVVYQDGKGFFRHRAVFVQVSPNRLQKVNDYMSPDYHEANSYESLNDERSNATGSTSADQQTTSQTNMQTVNEDIPSSDSSKNLQPNLSDTDRSSTNLDNNNHDIPPGKRTLNANNNIQYKTQNTDQ